MRTLDLNFEEYESNQDHHNEYHDHDELLEQLCLVVALRGGKTLYDVAKSVYGEPLPEDPDILLQVLDKLKDVETDDVMMYSQAQKQKIVSKK